MKRKKLTGGVPSVLVVAGMVFLVFVGGCGGEEATSSSVDVVDEQDGAKQEEAEPAKTEPTEESVASLGEPVTVGDVQWTVTKAEWSDILVSRFGDQEGNFILLNVDLTNNSNQDLRLATPMLALVDSEGREFEPDIDLNFFHVYGDENMFVGKVEPGDTKEGTIIFPVEPDASGFKFRVGEAKFASTVTRDIELGALPRAY